MKTKIAKRKGIVPSKIDLLKSPFGGVLKNVDCVMLVRYKFKIKRLKKC